MARITDDDLERLTNLLAKTTLGPWHLGLTFVYTRDAGNGRPRQIFNPDSAQLSYDDCAFVVAAHELMPALLAEIMDLRSHLSPAVGAPKLVDDPSDTEIISCPHCGSPGPFMKTTCQVYTRTIVSYTCDCCFEHFQRREN